MWKLQGGSYIPGFSGQAFGAGLQRDVTKTRKDQARKAAELEKYKNKRGSLGKWAGNIVGAGVGVGLGAMGMGPLGLTIGKTLGAGLGSRLGSSKMISGEGPSMAPGAGTGLLGSTYEQLGEAKGGIDEAMRGQAYGAGAAQLASGLTGIAGDKLGAQLGDMFGKWKAGRTGLSGYEGTGMGNALGLDSSAAERFSPGMKLFDDPASMTGYGGFSSQLPGQTQMPTLSFQSGGALGKAFGLGAIPQLESRSSKWFTPEAGSKMSGMQEKLRGMAGEGRLFDPETGDPMELTGVPSGVPEESMIERIKGAAGSMFNPFHGVEKEAPMQQYAQQLSPDIMSLLEEYGGKDEPEREPFDLMGKIGGLGRGAGNVLSSVINPFHGMERESPRSAWTGQPMQQGGMMPGGVSNALPYHKGGSVHPHYYWDDDIEFDEDMQTGGYLQGYQMGGTMPGGSISPYNLGGSVTQQPMAYQLGGLLKYKRSPTMG